MPKRLFATLITTFILFSLNIVPANAETVSCGSGGTFTIVDNVVTESSYRTDETTDPSIVTCAGDVNIPSGVVKIDDHAFSDRSITFVTIPNTVTEIDASAFGRTSLISVTIPDSVITIGDYAFYNTPSLTSVTIGNFVESIGNGAFEGTRLTSVTIPDSVINLGSSVFLGTSTLTSVTIGNSVTSIGNYAFSNNTSLTSVTIPDSVESIGDGAFENSTDLTSVTIGNSVESIGYYAFYGNTSLTSVTFLGNAPSTFDDAFSGVPTGTKANVVYNATGFPANGLDWKGLIVSYGSAPSSDSGSSSTNVATFTPQAVKTADAVFNLKNRKYLSKNAIKIRLRKNMLFERDPEDSFKYSIFKTSKKTCIMRGNYVTALKKTGSCDLNVTRTTAKGTKYKYWVKINYSK
jgi:hypothetical protein